MLLCMVATDGSSRSLNSSRAWRHASFRTDADRHYICRFRVSVLCLYSVFLASLGTFHLIHIMCGTNAVAMPQNYSVRRLFPVISLSSGVASPSCGAGMPSMFRHTWPMAAPSSYHWASRSLVTRMPSQRVTGPHGPGLRPRSPSSTRSALGTRATRNRARNSVSVGPVESLL